MRSTSRFRILAWSLGLLMVLLIPSSAFAAGFPMPDWWGDDTGFAPSFPTQPAQADLAGQLATDLNNARAQNGLSPLARSAVLDQIASARSQDMMNLHYFGHTTPSGTTVLTSLRSQGVRFRKAGEVITKNADSDDQSAETAEESFLHSPEHRAIILDPNYTAFGVGEATTDNGMHIFTAVYLQR